ncbi:MAG: heme o synthase [Thermoplasmata archaeon]|nr:heme o synthase [Thermoplasmata archaeon]
MTDGPTGAPAPSGEAGPKDSTGAPAHARVADYVTLTKPGITALIVLVAVGGFVLASPGAINLVRLGLLAAFGWAASSGAAMLNHYLDRDLDARMRRTRHRPLPGARIVRSEPVAWAGTVLAAAGIGGAVVVLNPLTGLSIALGFLTYVVVYTVWLKRRSSWNIVIGGFAGSAPALAGSAAAIGTWTPGVLAFALLVFLWTPPHFWSLAIVLKDDYAAVGLPMLPRMNDLHRSGQTVVVAAALLVPASLLMGWLGPISWPAFVALVILGVVFVVVAAPLWRDTARRTALRGFIYSGPYLLGVIVVVFANWMLLHPGFPATI